MVRKILFTATMLSTLFTVGCNSITTSYGNNSELALPAHEYNIYLQQEITTVLNQLTTRMSNGRVIGSGDGNVTNELEAVEYSINVVSECIEVIYNINITGSYEEEKEETIRLFNEVLNEFTKYKDCISNRNEQLIRKSISRMEILFTSLTALCNQVYK